MTFSSWGHLSALVFSPLTTRATFTKCQSCTLPLGQIRLHFTTRANSMKRADGKRVCGSSPESYAWSGRRAAAAHRWSLRSGSIHWRSSIATHSPSTASGVASAQRASKVDKTTDLCAADLHGGRARRKDNRRPRMLARVRPHRASCRPEAETMLVRVEGCRGVSRGVSRVSRVSRVSSGCRVLSRGV